MNLYSLIGKLEEKGIKLFLKDGQLKVKAAKDSLTPELLQEIKDNKAELISFLSSDIKQTQNIPKIKKISDNVYPVLSAAQERLWFLSELEDQRSSAYNQHITFLLNGKVSLEGLNWAFSELIKRHSILRTKYKKSSSGSAEQVIVDDYDFKINHQKVMSKDEAEAIFAKSIAEPFNLNKLPLIRVHLLELTPKEFILIIIQHHIVTDGVSAAILINELSEFYSAYIEKKSPNLPELPIEYIDYAYWEKEEFKTDSYKKKQKYWNDKLAGFEDLQLPLDKSRPAVFSYKGNHINFELDKKLSSELKNLAKTKGTTLYSLLLSAFNILLSRYSAQEDIIVSTVVANRNHDDLQNILGFFVNTLVLRNEVLGEQSFDDFLRKVSSNTIDAFSNQEVPFEELVNSLGIPRDTSRNPISQVMFVLQTATSDMSLDMAGVQVSPYSFGLHDIAKFDLTLEMFESSDLISGHFEYSTDLFNKETIERISRNFDRLLNAIVENSSAQIKDLRLLTDERRKQILINWNDTKAPYPKDKTIYQLFESQVNKTPENIALIFEDEKLNYKELNKKSNQLAHLIRAKYKKQNKKDLKPDSLIGLCVERSLDMIIGILGILKAGAAYVPLDPDYPQDRLEYMIEDSHEGLIITQKGIVARDGFLDKLHHDELLVIDSDEVKADLKKQSAANLEKVSGPDNLAYVIYTSGSTGKPKGTMLEQKSVINCMFWLQKEYGLTDKDKILQKTPISFDVSVSEYLWSLLFGATLVIAKPDGHKDPEYLAQLIGEQKVTFTHFVPSLLKVIIDLANADKQIKNNLSSLNKIFCAGEALNIEIVRSCSNLLQVELFNIYGPTEVAIFAIHYKCQLDVMEKMNLVPIGKGVYNSQMYILDNNLNPCPIGAPGELYIGGAGLARGYLNQEKLTSERFIPNPFAKELGLSKSDIIYKTGDLVRWLPDGNIEYLGRTDFQVKIRGFRVELGEIENVLAKHKNISQVSVIDKEKEGQKHLVAYYIIAKDKKVPEIDDLRSYLSETLPDYMVPAAFVKLDEMPLTPNGKINRRALPDPDMSLMGEEYIAPRNEIEENLAGIWCDILKIDKDKVGIHDNFFHLGGHSLLAIQLVARIHAKLNCDISIKNLFAKPKLIDLSLFIESQIKEGTGVSYSPIKKTKLLKDGNAMSFAQERLWFLDQFEGSNENYNIPMIFRLEGKLDIKALKTSLNQLVARHASFRTVFTKDKTGVGVQKILDKLELKLVAEELDNKAKGKALEKIMKAEINKEISTPFDFVKGPLIRVRLFEVTGGSHCETTSKQSPSQYVLVFNHHHIISDGVSIDIISKELSEFYQANIEQREAKLDKLPIQYVDFAAWQRAEFKKPEFQDKLKYWKDTLGDYSDLQLPTDKSRPTTFSYKGADFGFSLDKDLSAKLSKLAQDNGTTLYMVLLTAFNVLLSRYSGQEDIILGSPIANRYHHDLEGLVGFFVNTLILRNQVDSNKSVKDLLNQISQDTLSAFDNQEVPFEQIVELLDVTRDTSRNPIVQVMFSLQSFGGDASGESALKLPGVDIKLYDDASYDVAKFDLSLFMSDGGDELVGSFNYCTDLFTEDTISRLARNFDRLLESFVENSSIKIKELRLLTDERLKQILVDWNDTSAPYPKDKTIYQLFEEQVKKTPDNIAVIFEDEKLSYKDLNKKSNKLAHLIRAKYKSQNKKDLKPDSLIGLCVERSLDMIIGILGILKAGGAYVPLDPDYPQDRLEYMIEDSHEGLIITQKDVVTKDGFLDKLHHDELLIIDSDVVKADLKKQSDANLEKISSPDNLAYVIYTSGSTGRPKGVMIEHKSVNRLVCNSDYVDFSKGDKVLQAANISFDAATFEIWGALLNGLTLVQISENDLLNIASFKTFLKNYQISIMWMTVALFNQYISEDSSIFKGLKYLLVGGDALSPERISQLLSDKDKKPKHVLNGYGPTESTTFTTTFSIKKVDGNIPIGTPINNTTCYILDNNLNPCPIGAPGELYIGGAGLARGYLNQDKLTKERFISNPFAKELGLSESDKIYKTGDLVRWLSDGNIEYLGRTDFQVKIRGFRIELGEIENVLAKHENISQVSVIDKEKEGSKYLVAYYVIAKDKKEPEIDDLRNYLSETLPDYMVPAAFVKLDEMPLTPNGKINRRALPDPDMSSMGEEYVAASDDIEEKLIQIWQEILKLDKIGIYDQFFNLGGNSLLTIQLQSKIKDAFNIDLSIADIFQYPTVFAFAEFVRGKLGISKKTKEKQVKKDRRRLGSDQTGSQDIAIIGLACRAPGADNHKEFWNNLENSVESIRDLTDEELLSLNIDQKLLNDAHYVRRGGFVNNLEYFDAGFFGYSPLEAKTIDPQMRHFFECAWSALEDSGVIKKRNEFSVGVFSGKGSDQYLMENIMNSPDIINSLGWWSLSINNKYLSSKVSYHFNLDGPSFDVNTACSTGLVSVNIAVDNILSGQCDIALAGGVTLSQKSGYLYQEGMIASPDGHCRAFDEEAKGTVGGSAVGVVVLKRLDDALADNDQIYAVIKATAINNDGSAKVGYTAPSVEGQANVIRDAIEKSGVDPDTISYIEAHGTATPLGDPIEISALTQAYRNFTDKKQYCAIGSVKTNIGHTDTAAGVMGLIKTALALKHKKIPASLHFNKPNPEIDFENSPFFVNTELKDWEVPEGVPRRAGVSSFGIGGTNAHAILEEASEREASSESRKQQLLLLSAKTDTSVSAYADKLANFLKDNKKNKADIKLADVAYTLQVGRDNLKHRRCYVAESFDQAIDVLGKKAVKAQTGEISQEGVIPEVIFMFSGQGAQYVNMARDLYEQEPLFTEIVDQCCEILKDEVKLNLLEVLYPKNKGDIKKNIKAATNKITQTNYAQPALFVIEYALAKLLIHWGIEPKTMIGHSIGEYIAATIAGVFELKDALLLVATRGKLMHGMQAGSMLSVNLEEAKLKELLPKDLALAAVNSPSLCVVSGETKIIKDFKDKLDKKDISCTLLHTSHAFHSPMMLGAADEFLKVVKKVKKDAPKIGFISNLTGDMVTKEQAVSDQYWVDHLLNAVLFDKGVSKLLTDKLSCLVEIGPGRTLSTFALQNKVKSKSHHILTSIRHPKDEMDDLAMLLNLVGRLWLAGVEIDYDAFYEKEKRNKISIPTYCFDHKRYWIEASEKEVYSGIEGRLEIKPNMEDWFYEPSWKKANLPKKLTNIITKEDNCLIFEDDFGVAESLAASLEDKFSNIIRVKVGDKFCNKNDNLFTINPNNKSDYIELLQVLADKKVAIQHVVHAWSLSEYIKDITTDILASSNQLSFYSLLYLAQGLIEIMPRVSLNINVLTNNIWAVLDEKVNPQMSTITGPIKVITQEHPELRCRHIDIMLDSDEGNYKLSKWIKNTLITEFGCEVGKGVDREICYRYGQRWVRGFGSVKLDKELAEAKIEDGKVYLITGGLGGVGLSFAKYFAQKAKVKLALVSRKKLPEKSQWSDLIENNTDHAQFKILEKLLEIESLGSEVMVCSADIANESQVKSMIDDVINEFGKIDVAIHAAGVPGGGIVDLKTSEMVEKVFAPKLQGTLFLAKLMQKVKPKEFVFCSSLNAIFGAPSQIDYSGANAFLDSYSKYFEKLTKIKTVSINWLRWNEVGMAEETDVPDAMDKEREQARLYGVDPQEGCKLYEIIVNSGLKQVMPSKVDIESELLGIEQVSLDQEEYEISDIEYTGDVKSIVSNIWKEILGVEDIDDDDDFFELGGHSLLTIQLISRINKTFNLSVMVSWAFKNLTIAEQAASIGEDEDSLKSYQPILDLRKLEGNVPLFLVHAGNGGAECYRDLSVLFKNANKLISGVYGVESYNLNHLDKPISNMKLLAAKYIEYMKIIQPKGPYLIGGWSLGGSIAYEIAQQFKDQGEGVLGVYLIDAMGIEPGVWRKASISDDDLAIMLKEMGLTDEDIEKLLKLKPIEWELVLTNSLSELEGIEVILMKALNRIRSQDKKIDQIFKKRHKLMNQPNNGWDKYAKNLTVHEFDADHMSIMKGKHLKRVVKIIEGDMNAKIKAFKSGKNIKKSNNK